MRSAEPVEKWHAPPAAGELEELRAKLPATLRFGTRGWVYPGWKEIVWEGRRTEVQLEQNGLIEYAKHPLLDTIYFEAGADAAVSSREATRYAALPAGMHSVLQVHAEVTAAKFTRTNVSGIAGNRGGQSNPNFLDARFFLREIYDVYHRAFGKNLGTFLFPFPPTLTRFGISPAAFAQRLERFLASLPEPIVCAIEVREPQFLTREYARALATVGARHVFTTWAGMPPLKEQAQNVPISPERIIQVVDPSGRDQSRRQGLEPFDAIRAPNEKMRRAVIDLLLSQLDQPTYVLVHNEAEGCAPLTILALARMLASRM